MSNPTPELRTPEGEDGDYEVIRLSISWGMLSLLAFASLLTVQLFGPRVFGMAFERAVALTLPLSLGGFVLGLVGLRYGDGPQIARLGVFLNGVVLLCIFVLLPATFFIMRRLG
ncbi:MAG: hypothetical protein AAF657_13430 [Acidobacteriota bacterium]